MTIHYVATLRRNLGERFSVNSMKRVERMRIMEEGETFMSQIKYKRAKYEEGLTRFV